MEYGADSGSTVLLLHGGGLSWWNYREEAELLKARHHVLLPVLDGHAGSDRDFTSIEDNARELIGYIDGRFGGSVEAIGGLSLGAQVLAEMLSQRGDICRCALIESALAIPMRLSRGMIKCAMDMSYGLIEKPWFSRLQFKSMNVKPELYGDYYRDSTKISKDNMTAFLQASSDYRLKDGLRLAKAKTLVAAGSREQKKMLDSAMLLHGAIEGSALRIMDGYTHGELSLNHAGEYVSILEELMAAD